VGGNWGKNWVEGPRGGNFITDALGANGTRSTLSETKNVRNREKHMLVSIFHFQNTRPNTSRSPPQDKQARKAGGFK